MAITVSKIAKIPTVAVKPGRVPISKIGGSSIPKITPAKATMGNVGHFTQRMVGVPKTTMPGVKMPKMPSSGTIVQRKPPR